MCPTMGEYSLSGRQTGYDTDAAMNTQDVTGFSSSFFNTYLLSYDRLAADVRLVVVR